MFFQRLAGWALCTSTALALLTGSVSTSVAAGAAPLVFCGDPAYMPYSDRAGEGFENHIASVVGKALGRPVQYYWRSMREKDEYGEFLTATIQSKRCDILVDVPYAMPSVKTTRPYYISSYVFVTKKARHLGIDSLDSPQLRHLHIGYEGETPVQDGLKARTLIIGSKLFLTADQEDSSPQAILDALETNRIDVAMTWDPAVAYYLKSRPDLEATVIPNTRSQGAPEQYSFPMSMATRPHDDALYNALNKVVLTHAAQMQAVLKQYHIGFSAPDNANS